MFPHLRSVHLKLLDELSVTWSRSVSNHAVRLRLWRHAIPPLKSLLLWIPPSRAFKALALVWQRDTALTPK